MHTQNKITEINLVKRTRRSTEAEIRVAVPLLTSLILQSQDGNPGTAF
jgi:hypothetical protein